MKRRQIGREKNFAPIKDAKQPYILGIWHESVVFAPHLHSNHGIVAMVSSSRDGEVTARLVINSGNKAVRGSSSKHGARALMELVKSIKAGNPTCLIPDGPRGPALKLQGGIVTAAQLSGAPIIPFQYTATNNWVANTAWDKHRMPKPFSTIVMCYGEPIYVPRKLDAQEFKSMCQVVESAMLANKAKCDAAALALSQTGRIPPTLPEGVNG